MSIKLPISISKRILWRYVNLKIKRTIHHYHVFSVITILFDELLKDLKNGKKIKIFNFGTLSLNNTKPRKYHSVTQRQVVLSEARKILRFSMSPKIKKILRRQIDIKKTFLQ